MFSSKINYFLLLLLLACKLMVINSQSDGLIPLLDGRIVGGLATTIDRFPHQISLRYLNTHRCGGSIIHPNIIITAAHCVYGTNSYNFIVRAGTTFQNSGGVDRSVSRIIIHELYNPNTMNNDIAILIVSSNIQFSNNIQPASLPAFNEIMLNEGTEAFVSGWGSLREGGLSSTRLQYVQVNVMSQMKCYSSYQNKITSTMICAGFSNGGRDSCQGDSGGPLVTKNSMGQTKLIGVVSWGLGCARPNYPGVYANVAVLRPWIDQKIRSYLI